METSFPPCCQLGEANLDLDFARRRKYIFEKMKDILKADHLSPRRRSMFYFHE